MEKLSNINQLCGLLYTVMKHKDVAEMISVFLVGNFECFFIYNMTSEDGATTVPFMDYSINGGGGWLNVGCTYKEFDDYIGEILKTWPLEDKLIEEVGVLREKLAVYMNECITHKEK